MMKHIEKAIEYYQLYKSEVSMCMTNDYHRIALNTMRTVQKLLSSDSTTMKEYVSKIYKDLWNENNDTVRIKDI